jgi:hypothetical protein
MSVIVNQGGIETYSFRQIPMLEFSSVMLQLEFDFLPANLVGFETFHQTNLHDLDLGLDLFHQMQNRHMIWIVLLPG